MVFWVVYSYFYMNFGIILTYREDFYSLEFTALRFTATSTPLATRRMQILPINQHA
jgi:hypothetical protein